jgi:hypothetical protein
MNNIYHIYIETSSYTDGNGSKLSKISIEDFNEIYELLKSIANYSNIYNWTWKTELVKDSSKPSGWRDEYIVYEMYNNIPKETIKKFMKYLPSKTIDRIESFRVYKLEEINIEDIIVKK